MGLGGGRPEGRRAGPGPRNIEKNTRRARRRAQAGEAPGQEKKSAAGERPGNGAPAAGDARERNAEGLPRKEVFQPHLPVRLPCYDLAPVTGLTLGRS